METWAAPQARTVSGHQEIVRVPSVSEPWSATVGRVTEPPAPLRWHIGHYPGFREAKRQANARRQAMAAGTQSQTGSPFIGPQSAPEPAADSTGASPLAGTSSGVVFDGPSESDTHLYPPDSQIAAGPSYVVVAVNSLLAIYDKSGILQGSFQNFSSFFSSLGIAGEIFDPRIIYDQTDQRFILSAGEIDFTNLTNGHVLLAVSATSDPTGTWHKFAINSMGRTSDNKENTFPDFPGLGLSSSAVYITTNQFSLTQACLSTDTEGCYFSDAWIKVIGLPELLAGNPALNITAFTNVQTADAFAAFAIQPALTYGSSSDEFLVAARFDNYTGTALNLFAIPTSGTPTLSTADVAVPAYQYPSDALQSGGDNAIPTNDYRPLNAVWSNGSMFLGQNAYSSGSTGSGVAARWYQITLSDLASASLAQSGDINGVFCAYYPAVSVKADGTLGIAFTTSSQFQFASSAFTAREPSDALGTTRSYSIYWVGGGPYDEVGGQNRWGDYSGISEDPDGNSLWMITEYAGTPDPHFGTAVVQFTAPPALTVSPSALNFGVTLLGQSSSPMTLTVTNISGNSVTLDTAALGGPNSADFSISSDGCSGQTIAANQTCAISLTFKPSVQDPEDAYLSFSYAGNEFITVGMTGFGFLEAIITFSPSSMTFPPTTVGAASPPQTVTLTNTGNISTTAFSLFIGGSFTQTNNCAAPLVPGASCQATVVFHPTGGGTNNGGLLVQWNAPGPPSYFFTGVGVTSPAAVFCPPSLSFPTQTIGTASAVQSVIVTNNGSSVLTISGISASGAFSETNNCPGTLPQFGSCVINLTFSPAATGSLSGSLNLTDDAPGSPQSYPLTGTGMASAANLLINSPAVATAGAKSSHLLSATLFASNAQKKATELRAFRLRPLAFEKNEGQFSPSVKFIAHSEGHSVAITKAGVVFSLTTRNGGSTPPPRVALHPVSPRRGDILGAVMNLRIPERGSKTGPTNALVRMTLVGQNPDASVSGSGELPGKTNYFIGNYPSRWRTDVPNYTQVKLERVYPGIDLVYYGNQNRLEYDFVVAPHSSPSAIRLKFEGQRHLRIDTKSGDLVLETRTGEARLHKPLVYQTGAKDNRSAAYASVRQTANVTRPSIGGRFVLSSSNEVRFQLMPYDQSAPLIIDPVLSFSTYLAGTDYDSINGVAVDPSGNVYVTGTTFSTDFPVTPGSFQQTCVQSFEQCSYPYEGSYAFVSKLSADGSTLIYSTYLGGDLSRYVAINQGNAIAVDSAGDAFVGGTTTSPNFPVTSGAFQAQCKTSSTQGCNSGFVTKLNPSGSGLLYSTYLGGTGASPPACTSGSPVGTQPNGLAIDSAGDAYIAGSTGVTDFPTTPGAFEATIPPPVGTDVCAAPTHGFVSELNPSGTTEIYSTFLGGTTNEVISGLARDAAGNIYVAGTTASVDFPTTPGALQPGPYVPGFQSNVYRGFVLGFVTKFDPTWNLLYSTYYSQGQIQGLAADTAGSAYVVGPTPYLEGQAGLAAKLHPQGCGLIYSTALPGGPPPNNNTVTAITVPTAIAVNGSGNAYVVARPTYASYGAGTQPINPLQTPTLGNIFVGEISSAGTSFPFWTTLGGSGRDSANAVATDSQGNIYVAGQTSSPDFPTTPGTFQADCPTCGSDVGISDSEHQAVGGFVTKISPGSLTGVILTRSELTLASAPAGTISAPWPEAVGLLNSLTVPLTISSVSVSGSAFSLAPPTQTTCSGTLAPGAGCSVYVQFRPTIYGAQTGTLTINDSGPGSPRLIALNGSGTADFQITGLNSNSVIKGTDSIQFNIYISPISGAPALSGNVALTCTAASPATCTFNPSSGPVNGTYSELTVSGLSSVSGSALNLSAIGSWSGQTSTLPLSIHIQDFSMVASQPSATVRSGQTATYPLSVSPAGGFNYPVGLTCTGGPALTTCSISPPSFTLDGTDSAPATVTVTTTAPSSSLPMERGPRSPLRIHFGVPPAWLMVLAAIMAVLAAASRRRRPAWLGLAVMVLLVGLWVSCGGGGSSSPPPPPGGNPGTAPGVYTLTVTGASSSNGAILSHSVNLTLNVQ
ncbi:MAG TPA: choice-of-anchor D domain-containing protein [Terriglobia bacterium]|nr:choice-of-anchor D domain-containing protein [Terriglobia bacterium]